MLDEKVLVDYINLYRHDLMNNLQLIHGYSQLKNTKQMEYKLNEVITVYAKERSLFKLNANKFTLFVLFINQQYSNVKIDYNIDAVGSKLETQDNEIFETTKSLIDYFALNEIEAMFHWLLEIKYDNIKEQTKFTFSLQYEDKISHFFTQSNVKSLAHYFPLDITENNDVIQYSFIVEDEL